MKKSSFILPFLMLLVLLQSCSDDPQPATKSKVSFNFNSSGGVNGGRIASSSLEDVSAVVLSLETSDGVPVVTQQHVNLLTFGGGFVTEPLDLLPGNYVITEFMLENDLSDILFATPLAGSTLAKLVKHPLHYGFTVAVNKSVTVTMEVVPVDAHLPADFGYAAFNVQVVRPLSVSVFTMGSTVKLSSAKAYIIKENDTLATYALGAKINLIPFTLDPDETYRLDIIKSGFSRFTTTFIYDSLAATPDGYLLKAFLSPAFTFSIETQFNPYYDPDDFELPLGSSGTGDYVIDWGDGTSDPVTIGEVGGGVHHYPNANASYFITVTGELNKLTTVDSWPNEVFYGSYDLQHLKELRSVNCFLGGPSILDLSRNTKIQSIVFGGEKIVLPSDHDLSAVVLFGDSLADQLDDIIARVYLNAKAKGIKDGQFGYSLYPDSDEEIGLGTPSATSMTQLKELHDVYGWMITPSVE